MPKKNNDNDLLDPESDNGSDKNDDSGSEEEEEYVVEKVMDKRIVKNGKVISGLLQHF